MNKILDQIIASGELIAVRALGTCNGKFYTDKMGGYHEYNWRGKTYYIPERGGVVKLHRIGEYQDSPDTPDIFVIVHVQPDGHTARWYGPKGEAYRVFSLMNLDRKFPIAERMSAEEALAATNNVPPAIT